MNFYELVMNKAEEINQKFDKMNSIANWMRSIHPYLTKFIELRMTNLRCLLKYIVFFIRNLDQQLNCS